MYTIYPSMTLEESQHWQEELNGYIVERTGQALLDLDTPYASDQ